uniref:Uncharacterized protein n=1 Tax=Zea mays TaxID=4577 RepID=A0A804LVT5_MAIZE
MITKLITNPGKQFHSPRKPSFWASSGRPSLRAPEIVRPRGDSGRTDAGRRRGGDGPAPGGIGLQLVVDRQGQRRVLAAGEGGGRGGGGAERVRGRRRGQPRWVGGIGGGAAYSALQKTLLSQRMHTPENGRISLPTSSCMEIHMNHGQLKFMKLPPLRGMLV